ncbi:MAG: fibronectin type III domain-containing protein [Candidatus Saccharibacteria bacterium]|nr:fibronectin type III domain-containing protein [Rhodoferax sp.]
MQNWTLRTLLRHIGNVGAAGWQAGLLLVSAAAFAQPVSTLAPTGSLFALNVPYFEYGTGSSKLALAANFTTSTLASFVLDGNSVKSVALVPSVNEVPSIAATVGGYRLTVPYFEYAAGGVTRAFAVNLNTTDLRQFAVDVTSLKEVSYRTTALAAPTAITVSETTGQTVGTYTFGSSSKLVVNWTAPVGYTVDHYVVTATEVMMNTSVSASVAVNTNSTTLIALKAATPYSVAVKACKDSACSASGSSAVASGTTATEFWQMQGSGNTVATLTKPVSDGNARLSATRFGPEAGIAANTVQIYYGPIGVQGLAVGTTSTISASSPSSYLNFTSLASTSGIRSPSTATDIQSVATGQGVPLSAALGGKVRLFFEAGDVNGKTRIYSIDSTDGYAGRDFNIGSPSICSTSADYQTSGNCPLTLQIGLEGDTTLANAKISNARQHKLGWPTQTDWRWDGATGTFMVFTVGSVTGCSTSNFNHGYAVWNGSKFDVQYDSAGCPKLFKSVQAGVPMHLGDARYKMYYGDPGITTGKNNANNLPFLGPKKLIYADGKSSAAAATVEFEDWENVSLARNVNFLWPNGDLFNATAEGYIDDFQFLAPTGNLDLQVLYLTLTDGTVVPFAATAILLNP